MRLGVVGLGYVGLTLSIAAADCGFDVYGVEINSHIKDCLKRNKAHFFEPGLDVLIEKHSNKTFHCVEKFPRDRRFDAFVITVGTPLKKEAKKPEFDHIRSAIQSIQTVYDGTQLVILRSTVSVGTTREIVIPFLKSLLSKKPEERWNDDAEVLVSMCPERTIEGKAVEELRSLPQIVSGNNVQALSMAKRIFSKIAPAIIEASSLEEAELVKLYCNTYRDMEFAIGNAFCLAAQKFGLNGIEVIRHANEGYSRAGIAMPGFVAGPCLEKDAYILTDNMEDCPSRQFILFGRHLNESLERAIVHWVKVYIGKPMSEKVIVLSGMAFKGRPETSDLRGSSSVNIAKELHRLGYHLRLHDFVVPLNDMASLGLGEVFDDFEKACQNAAAVLILNNHLKYSNIQRIYSPKKGRMIFFDVWQMCRQLREMPNVSRYTLGNFLLGEEEQLY